VLEEKILGDYKEAMKSRDTLKSSALSFLRAELMNAAIAKKDGALDDNDCLSVIKKQIKQHQDSIEQFKKGNRQDLADKEAKELSILQSYLPPQLSENEISKIIEEVIISTASATIKDMGRVMKEVTAKIGPGADGRLVSTLVRARLSKAE